MFCPLCVWSKRICENTRAYFAVIWGVASLSSRRRVLRSLDRADAAAQHGQRPAAQVGTELRTSTVWYTPVQESLFAMPEIVIGGCCGTCADSLVTQKNTIRRQGLLTAFACSIVVASIVMCIVGFTKRPDADYVMGVCGAGFSLLSGIAFCNWYDLLMQSIYRWGDSQVRGAAQLLLNPSCVLVSLRRSIHWCMTGRGALVWREGDCRRELGRGTEPN